MTIHRLQLNGLTEQQWKDLAALAASSGISRSEYVRRCVQSVVDDGYVPPMDYLREACRVRPAKSHRYWCGHWVYDDRWPMAKNLVINASKPFLEAIDDERKRYGIRSRHMFVFQCVAWYLDMKYVWENDNDRLQESYRA